MHLNIPSILYIHAKKTTRNETLPADTAPLPLLPTYPYHVNYGLSSNAFFRHCGERTACPVLDTEPESRTPYIPKSRLSMKNPLNCETLPLQTRLPTPQTAKIAPKTHPFTPHDLPHNPYSNERK